MSLMSHRLSPKADDLARSTHPEIVEKIRPPARKMPVLSACLEVGMFERMTRRWAWSRSSTGKSGTYVRAKALSAAGAVSAVLAWRCRAAAAASCAALVAASALTRWGTFHAGLASAHDPLHELGVGRPRRGCSPEEASRNCFTPIPGKMPDERLVRPPAGKSCLLQRGTAGPAAGASGA
jgi:hypothetical protein